MLVSWVAADLLGLLVFGCTIHSRLQADNTAMQGAEAILHRKGTLDYEHLANAFSKTGSL